MSIGVRAIPVPLLIWICLHFFSSIAAADGQCREPAGRLVSVQGQVQVQSSGQQTWVAVRIDDSLCPGDGGRAAVALANESILRIDQNGTLSIGSTTTGKSSLLKLMQGVLHIFSHRPNALKIETPYVSGAVEGTEFLVRAEPEKTVIIVFEGKVSAVNGQGRLEVASGQAIVAERGMAPQYITVVRPRDAVHWMLYEAYALQAIIEVVQNNPEQALRLASKAVALNPRSPAAALAMSYARQAVFDIPGALAILDQADESNP